MATQRGNSWQATVYINGERKRKAFATKAEAEAYERNPHDPQQVTVDAVFRKGYDFLWSTKRNPDTHRITEELINRLGASKLVQCITGADVQDLVMTLRKCGNSGATINRKLSALRMLLKFAADRDVIKGIPRFPARQEESEGRERYLTRVEAETILYNMDSDNSNFAEFLLHTGARVGEALALRWSDIDGDKVTFRWQTTKSKRTRVIGLNSIAQDCIGYSKLMGWEAPFSGIHYDAFAREFREAKQRAGLGEDDEVVPHILRHTHASWLVQKGVAIQVVSKLLGHSTLQVTMRYAKLAPDNLVDVTSVLVSV